MKTLILLLAIIASYSASAQQLSWEEKINPQYQIDLKKLQGEEALRQANEKLNQPFSPPAPQPTKLTLQEELNAREIRREELLQYLQNFQNAAPTPENEFQAEKYMQALRKNEEQIDALRIQISRVPASSKPE